MVRAHGSAAAAWEMTALLRLDWILGGDNGRS